MFKRFYPDEYIDSVYSMPLADYYEKGYRGLILDIDNTLVEHGAPCDDRAAAFFESSRNIGFKTCLISNNNEERVRPFAEGVGSPYVANAGKPGKRGYLTALEVMHTDRTNTIFIGDQLFTDICGANSVGIYCILVKYIKYDKHFHIRLKRLGEKIVLACFFRHMRKAAE